MFILYIIFICKYYICFILTFIGMIISTKTNKFFFHWLQIFLAIISIYFISWLLLLLLDSVSVCLLRLIRTLKDVLRVHFPTLCWRPYRTTETPPSRHGSWLWPSPRPQELERLEAGRKRPSQNRANYRVWGADARRCFPFYFLTLQQGPGSRSAD